MEKYFKERMICDMPRIDLYLDYLIERVSYAKRILLIEEASKTEVKKNKLNKF